jgi:hypothetical protein
MDPWLRHYAAVFVVVTVNPITLAYCNTQQDAHHEDNYAASWKVTGLIYDEVIGFFS